VKNLKGGKNVIEIPQSAKKMPLVIGNTGITASTVEVVADVRKLKDANPLRFEKIFSEYHSLAIDAKVALLEGDVISIGKLMNQNHKLLQDITVSSEVNDELVEIALDNGALGAKMTGTGRGGLVIALAENNEVQKNISNAIETLGAKMTGTGRGGLVIALAENNEVQKNISNAIEKKGYDAWKTMIG